MRVIKWILSIVVVFIIFAYLGVTNGWFSAMLPIVYMDDQAKNAMVSSTDVEVIEGDEWFSFIPKKNISEKAIVLYPGAFCDPKGYAAVLHELAKQGYMSFVTNPPNFVSALTYEAFLDIKKRYPSIKTWIVLGHSMGGAAALRLLNKHPGSLDALVMLDAYSNAELPMADIKVPVLSLYATAHHNPDRPQIFEDAKQYLPAHTNYVAIEGGDHYQFGWFREEDFKEMNTATISAEQQIEIVTKELLRFIKTI